MGDSEIQIGDIVSLIQVYNKEKVAPIGLVVEIVQGYQRELYTIEWFDDGSFSGEPRDNLRRIQYASGNLG